MQRSDGGSNENMRRQLLLVLTCDMFRASDARFAYLRVLAVSDADDAAGHIQEINVVLQTPAGRYIHDSYFSMYMWQI
jgi:hypothetical protein